jgi:AcrR family transcriptional regulator
MHGEVSRSAAQCECGFAARIALDETQVARYSATTRFEEFAMVKRVAGSDESVGVGTESNRQQIIRSTNQLLKRRGLGVSMDEIAAATGVSRRTLFRYFPTRDQLVAEALEWEIDGYHEDLAQRILEETWLDEWLASVVPPILNGMEGGGQAFWELAASSDEALPPVIAAVNRRRRERRVRATARIAQHAWSRAGGNGRCPQTVLHACAMTLTVFNVRSMRGDYAISLDTLATRVIVMLSTVIRAEVEASAARSNASTARKGATRRG